jgi:hypothetical protein
MRTEQEIREELDDLLIDIKDCREANESIRATALFTASEYLRWVLN